MPIRWNSKILLIKLEATYATDAAPTGADNAILATNIKFSPMEGQDVSRELELPWLAAQATIAAGLHCKMSFRVELVPSGAPGTPPAWGPVLRICGVAETITADTSVEYEPISDGHESGTVHFWIGPTRYIMRGSRGTATKRFNAQGIPYLEVELTGLFAMPAEAARVTPTLSAFLKPRIVSMANTPVFKVAGLNMVMRNFSIALGNDVQMRLLVGPDAENVLIVDRNEAIATQVEAVPLATYNPFQRAQEEDEALAYVPVEIQHGATAGRIVHFKADRCQQIRLQEFEEQQKLLEWPLRFKPLPLLGDDQWKLTLT